MKLYLTEKDDYFISTDNALLDFDAILRFISVESYWGQGRTAAVMRRAIENSISVRVGGINSLIVDVLSG